MQIYADSKGKVALDVITLCGTHCMKCHGNVSQFYLIAHYANEG